MEEEVEVPADTATDDPSSASSPLDALQSDISPATRARLAAFLDGDEAFDSWATDRTGNPAWMMEGWQLTSHRDVVKLMHGYTNAPGNDEFKIASIAPMDRRWQERRKVELGVRNRQKIIGNESRFVRSDELRDALIVAVREGALVAAACRRFNVKPNTYSKWRQRYPDFALKMDAARFERDNFAGTTQKPTQRPDFTEFRRYFFGYETYEHHRKIIEAIETTPPGGFTMILVPPEAGKTTLLEDWLCYQIAMDPNHRVLVVTEAGSQGGHAQKLLASIKDRLVDADGENPDAQYDLHLREFHARYGPFRDPSEDKDKPWNANYIKVHRASGRRDYTLQAAGWRSKVYGARCDTLLFDDVQSAESLNLTNNILDRMRGTFFSRPGKAGRIVYIGTRVGLGDVPERLIKSGAVDNLVVIPALDSDGNSYCPEMWPEEALAQKRKLLRNDVGVSEAAWWCNYMQDPRQAENPTFDLELLETARDPELRVGQVPLNHRCVLGLDPALGGHTALTCTAWTPESFVVVDVWDQPDLSRNEEIFSMVADYARRYRPEELVVEINSLQRGIARDDRLRKLARDHGFVITEHETTKTKWDQDFGVASMAGSFIRREVKFPDETEFCRRRLEPLLTQLEQWRPGIPARLLRQDMVMAVWFPWRRWMEYREASRTDETMWEAQGTPWSQAGSAIGTPWGGGRAGEVVSIFGQAG